MASFLSGASNMAKDVSASRAGLVYAFAAIIRLSVYLQQGCSAITPCRTTSSSARVCVLFSTCRGCRWTCDAGSDVCDQVDSICDCVSSVGGAPIFLFDGTAVWRFMVYRHIFSYPSRDHDCLGAWTACMPGRHDRHGDYSSCVRPRARRHSLARVPGQSVGVRKLVTCERYLAKPLVFHLESSTSLTSITTSFLSRVPVVICLGADLARAARCRSVVAPDCCCSGTRSRAWTSPGARGTTRGFHRSTTSGGGLGGHGTGSSRAGGHLSLSRCGHLLRWRTATRPCGQGSPRCAHRLERSLSLLNRTPRLTICLRWSPGALERGAQRRQRRAAAASLAGDGFGVPSTDQSPRATLAAACAEAATATKASDARMGLPSNSSLISTGEFLLLVGDVILRVGADLGGVM